MVVVVVVVVAGAGHGRWLPTATLQRPPAMHMQAVHMANCRTCACTCVLTFA